MITSLLNADEELEWKEIEAGYRYQQFMFDHPKLVKFWDVWLTIKFWPLFLVCKIKGHDLVDNGYATPDSGCIQMDCRRCGYSYPTHWLY